MVEEYFRHYDRALEKVEVIEKEIGYYWRIQKNKKHPVHDAMNYDQWCNFLHVRYRKILEIAEGTYGWSPKGFEIPYMIRRLKRRGLIGMEQAIRIEIRRLIRNFTKFINKRLH